MNQTRGKTTQMLCEASDWAEKNPGHIALVVVHHDNFKSYVYDLIATHGLSTRIMVASVRQIADVARGRSGAYWFDHAVWQHTFRPGNEAKELLRGTPRWRDGFLERN